jgi:2,4-dienoyl-CoA reductase-like NADH-dependent reductase (Old Yellow Enzyme family)
MTIDLFQPFKLGSLEIRNRFMRSATWDATAGPDGEVTDNSLALFGKLAKGNIGLIVTGYAFISPLGRAARGQYGIDSDARLPGLRRLTDTIHRDGGKIAVQIMHAGMNSRYLMDKGIAPLAVANVPEADQPHRQMDEGDIQRIIEEFVVASKRAVEAGFDAVQFHGAHGFLITQFLSPITNRRQDRWGGTPENRRRFLLEITDKVSKAIAPVPLLIKYGVQDDRPGGLTRDEGVETARQMAARGIAGIEISAGIGTSTLSTKEGDPERAYYRERAAAVKHAVSVPVALVGGIRSLDLAQAVVDSGDADMISICRPFIREPELLKRWQRGDRTPAKCISCNRCFMFPSKGQPLECGEEWRLREAAAGRKT